jgi:hypothetical protein
MLTLVLRIGNHDFGFPAGDPKSSLHLLVMLIVNICAFVIVGTVIGMIFRRKILLQVLVSGLVSCGAVWYLLNRAGFLSSKYSMSEKFEGLYELSGFYVLFCVAPAILAAVFIPRWLLSRKVV